MDDTVVIPQPQDPQQPGGVPVRQQPRTGVVVALTLGAVLLLGLVFGGGFALGRSTAPDTTPTSSEPGSASAPSGEGTPTQDAGADAGGSIDDCLVGTWRTTEHSESVDTEQGRFTVTGVKRQLEITADGTETITYDGTPAAMAVESAQGEAIFTGTVTYQVSTSGSTLNFTLKSVDGNLKVRLPDGKESEQELQPGSGPVQYTCDETSFTQTAEGYKSVMERVD